ncbi:MAG TPA: hypothetical protein PLZ43_14070 [bacterium]|nr:hypothetical protein [bacterium]
MRNKRNAILIFILALFLISTISFFYWQQNRFVDVDSLDLGFMRAIELSEFDNFDDLISFSESRRNEKERNDLYRKALLYSLETAAGLDCFNCPHPTIFDSEIENEIKEIDRIKACNMCDPLENRCLKNNNCKEDDKRTECMFCRMRADKGTGIDKYAMFKSIKIIKRILPLVKDVDIRDKYRSSPLSLAARLGNYDVFMMVLNKGAEVNYLDENGSNLLNLMVRYSDRADLRILSYLTSNGVDPYKKNEKGYSAYDYAKTGKDDNLKELNKLTENVINKDNSIKIFEKDLQEKDDWYTKVIQIFEQADKNR